jgi:S-adenosyl-L-methionine hydrolase (adenosine-forming)
VSIITLTSDYGPSSPYAAILKGALYRMHPEVRVVDVSHSIRKFDVVEAAFVLDSVVPEFPAGTVHIVAVRSCASADHPHRVIKYDGQYFIAADTGIFSVLFDKVPEGIYDLSTLAQDVDMPTFPERQFFVPAAAHLSRGGIPEVIGRPVKELVPAARLRPSMLDENTLSGHVVHIDGYGNVVTNIHKSVFKEFGKGREFFIELRSSRMVIRRIEEGYQAVVAGDRVAVFNSRGLLEIAINNHAVADKAIGTGGGADQLLGIKMGQAIRIQFAKSN